MAFSDIKTPAERKFTGKAFLRVAERKGSTITYGTFSLKTGFRGKTVQVQIDADAKKVRCRVSDSGVKVNHVGVFFISGKELVNAIGSDRILLVQKGEWWYGDYSI